MNNKIMSIIFALFAIIFAVRFIHTGILMYLGFVVLNLCGALMLFFKNTKLVLLFMFLAMAGALFSFYHFLMYFI